MLPRGPPLPPAQGRRVSWGAPGTDYGLYPADTRASRCRLLHRPGLGIEAAANRTRPHLGDFMAAVASQSPHPAPHRRPGLPAQPRGACARRQGRCAFEWCGCGQASGMAAARTRRRPLGAREPEKAGSADASPAASSGLGLGAIAVSLRADTSAGPAAAEPRGTPAAER